MRLLATLRRSHFQVETRESHASGITVQRNACDLYDLFVIWIKASAKNQNHISVQLGVV